MRTVLAHADRLLHAAGPFDPDRQVDRPTWVLMGVTLVFGAFYGAVMGSYNFDGAHRLLQMLYAAIKVPMLLLATSLLCLPGFFVMNTVLGLREDWREALRAIHAAQAALSIALASLAPFTRFLYFCSENYRAALLFNTGMFALATLAGHWVMVRYYRRLTARQPRHRLMLRFWVVFYAFVGIQMAWMLRPFIGSPDMRTAFFRPDPFSNAYVVILDLLFRGW